MPCPLCTTENEHILFQTPKLRVIVVHEELDVPAFCRVIWTEHVTEMTDLSSEERQELMHAVFTVEAAMREILRPTKINLASLGNIVPHIHWHVIARFHDDAHFPTPIWAAPHRENIIMLPENWVKLMEQYLVEKM